MKTKLITALLLIMMMVSAGCNSKKTDESSKSISIAYVDGWAEGVAMTHIAKELLIESGYKVDVKQASVDLVFASLANGDVDVFMDVWLPATHREKLKRIDGKIERLGTNFKNARLGVVVPSYVTINSIEELSKNADKFDGKIIGIEKGAGITAKTELVIKDYKLNLKQLNSSGVAMLSELQKAISENRWIAVTGWSPHWMFSRYDLKFLEDPKKVYGESETVYTYARKGFKDTDTFAANLFANFNLNDNQISELMLQMEVGKKTKDEIAKDWIAEHKELVDSWIGKIESNETQK